MNRIFKNPDVASGVALLVVGGVATWLAYGIRRGPDIGNLPPNFVPLLCTFGVIVCGVVLLFKGFRSVAAPLPLIADGRIAAVAVLLGLYFWFFEEIDFRVGSYAFVLLTMLAMGCRSWVQLLVTPVAVSGGVYLVFRYLFEILLPTWT